MWHSLTRHAFSYLIGRVATGLVGLLSLVAFTRVLSPTDYGRYAVVVAIAALIAGVGFQWLRQCLVRFSSGTGDVRQPLLGTIGVLFAGLLVATAIIGATFAIAVGGDALRVGISALEISAICCLAGTQAWFELCADASRASFRPWRYSAATFIRALLSLLLGVSAALLTHRVSMVAIAMAIAYLLASTVTVPRWFIGLLNRHAANWTEVKRLAAYGLPLAGALGMTFILDSADRLMLAAMRGYAEAGIYSSAYNLAEFSINATLYGLGLGSLPLVVKAFNSRDERRVSQLLGNNLVLNVGFGLPVIAGLVILAPGLDQVLLGNNVPGRSDLVTMIVAVGVGLGAIRACCFDVVFLVSHRTSVYTLIISLSTLLNVLLNLELIPRWGAVGAAMATLIAFLIAFVASWLLSRQYLSISASTKDIAKIVLGCVTMVAVLALLSPSAGSWRALVLAIACGAAVYLLIVVILDTAGSRRRLTAFLADHK